MAVRIGVIGVGFGAKVHIPAYQAEGLEVVAVCARRAERGADAADRFGVPNVFTDHREMLKMPGLDAVTVASPRPLHYEMTMDALEAGKHVICEKPFATQLHQARQMWEASRHADVTSMVAHEFRFAPARALAREFIHDGYIGKLQMATVSVMRRNDSLFEDALWSDADDAATGNGLLWSQGSHYVDCLRHWFGEVTTVSGKVFTHAPPRVVDDSGQTALPTADDAFTFTLEFEDGGWATMTASYASAHGPGVRVEVYGTDGTLVTPQPNVDSPNPPPHGKLLGARVGHPELAEIPIPEWLDPYHDEGHEGLMPMRMLAREFVRGVESGTSPSPSFYDGYRCQQVLHAVRESSRTGREVVIPLEDTDS